MSTSKGTFTMAFTALYANVSEKYNLYQQMSVHYKKIILFSNYVLTKFIVTTIINMDRTVKVVWNFFFFFMIKSVLRSHFCKFYIRQLIDNKLFINVINYTRNILL
jgi:hypothetical protein